MKSKNETDLIWLIFTDLDGTLLDEKDYSFEKANQSIEFLKIKRYPIIPCTSKTHQEVIEIRKRINISDPFIVENGSAIFLPSGSFSLQNTIHEITSGYQVIILGKKYTEILNFFDFLRKESGAMLSGFSEMSVDKIKSLTGLTSLQAGAAKSRSFSEPFIFLKPYPEIKKLEEIARHHHFRILQGNRFYHLLGDSNKGKAVKLLTELYHKNFPDHQILSLGLGDSPNDIEMLETIDYPVLVKNLKNTDTFKLKMNNLLITSYTGPAGWQEAVFKIVGKIRQPDL